MLNELTDLPDDAARISELANLNARIRTEGTRNLIEAARRSGSPKILAQAHLAIYLMGPMPKLSQNWSVPFSPRAVLRYAMDSSTGLARITSSNHPRNLGSTLIELPNKRWRRCVSQRALSSLSTESVTAIRPTANSFPPPPKVQLVEYLSLSRRRQAVFRGLGLTGIATLTMCTSVGVSECGWRTLMSSRDKADKRHATSH